jgi:hypothetical protein
LRGDGQGANWEAAVIVALQVWQRVHFSIISPELSPDKLTERIGLAPDEVITWGIPREGSPVVPKFNAWEIFCYDLNLTIDEQIEEVVRRLVPVRDGLLQVTQDPNNGVEATLAIVRYLDHDDGVLDGIQHRLLGWYLPPETLSFLAGIGAGIVADEYGQE